MNHAHDMEQARGEITRHLGDSDLIVVSNRQPYRHDYEQDGDGKRQLTVDEPAGGLTAGLDPVLQRTDGTWIAWGDGDADAAVAGADDCVRVPPSDPAYTLRRLWLSDDQVNKYYYGYSNQVLWPLCHGFTENVNMNELDPYWEQYRRVNDMFADAVAERATNDSLVWFQDYHLARAPRAVRSQVSERPFLMQFWHIPWPSEDTFRICPQHRALLDGLLANDLLGFHTERDCTRFLTCVAASLDAAIEWSTNRVWYNGEWTAVRAFPMGVDADTIKQLSGTADATAFWHRFTSDHGIDTDASVALGVDRLDYTKGIVERLDALERLWETRPEWRGRLTYVQKACESRSDIPAYQALQGRVMAAINQINARFGTHEWQPVVYTDDMLSQTALYGLYRHSDVALVTPLRDGMNLVAKEYVAAQNKRPGVLLLSESAGAYEQLGEHALTIDPHETQAVAETIETALTTPPSERRTRMRQLRQTVETNDLFAWMTAIVRTARTVRQSSEEPPPNGTRRSLQY